MTILVRFVFIPESYCAINMQFGEVISPYTVDIHDKLATYNWKGVYLERQSVSYNNVLALSVIMA